MKKPQSIRKTVTPVVRRQASSAGPAKELAVPSVYVEEVSSGVRNIEGVATAITVFIGPTQRGPVNRAVKVRNVVEYESKFGGVVTGGHTAQSVRQYFLNGGADAFVVRVARQLSRARLERALQALDVVERFNLLVMPGFAAAALVAAAATYCRQWRAFLILDAPAVARSPTEMTTAVVPLAAAAGDLAAIYYPWTWIADPQGATGEMLVPPGGAVAGVLARIDARRGVWKAPAGNEAGLRGVIRLAQVLTDAEQQLLNEQGINGLRSFPGVGPVVWGARTLAAGAGIESEFKYVSVRRHLLFVEVSIEEGTRWVVFEPNDANTWNRVQDAVENFLTQQWRAGALLGSNPREAFFVRIGLGTTMTQTDLQAGRLIIEVGMALVRPAEFVILRIQHRLST